MTYNVHACVGTDGQRSEERIAAVIAEHQPDVVALQELDASRSRSRGLHQTRHLAELLKMQFHFHPALRQVDEEYGDAILSRLPMTLVKTGILPTATSRLAFEPRGALLVKIESEAGAVYLINTHLGLSWAERRAQTAALLSTEWYSDELRSLPFILCGDLNALPGSQVHRLFQKQLHDTQLIGRRWPSATFPSRWPLIRLDYVFINQCLQVDRLLVPRDQQARIASDHLPLIVDLTIRPQS